jgi:hypothetical protein
MKTQRLAAVTVLAACLAAAGCDRNKQTDATDGGKTASASGSSKIPQDARRVSEATGGRLIHRPLRDGTVYVQDGTTGKLVYSGHVRANSNVVVDAAANALTVNDQQVKSKVKLDPHHTYRLYFQQL